MTLEDLSLVVQLCRAAAGLEVSPEKTYLIESRLSRLAQQEGLASAAELLGALRDDRAEALAWRVVEAMTSQETAFFRDRTVFAAIEARLAADLQRGASPRLWSAACSSGQEALSLAMIAARVAPEPGRVDIAASDLSRAALERARTGLYSQSEIQRGLPIRLLLKHFDKAGEEWRASLDLRRRVRWGRINLIGPLAAVGKFDVILCRNVVCAMAGEVRSRVLAGLCERLADGGWLILGANDDLGSVDAPLAPVDAGHIFRHRREGGRAAAA